ARAEQTLPNRTGQHSGSLIAIHPAATFLYKLVLRGTEAPWRLIASLQDPTASTGDDEFDARLVGHSPAVDIWGDRIGLIARHRRLASAAAAFRRRRPPGRRTRTFPGFSGGASCYASCVRAPPVSVRQ